MMNLQLLNLQFYSYEFTFTFTTNEFTTTRFSSVLSCEDLLISSFHRSANM